MKQAATLVGFGSILGIISAVVAIAIIRMGYRGMTEPTELRGLRSSIGEIPMPSPPPDRAEMLPPISPILVPDVPADFVDHWLERFESRYPEHAHLFKALLLVLNHRPEIPASTDVAGHGGRTLLQHSILTAWVMTDLAPTWVYKGLHSRDRTYKVVDLSDPHFKFNADDPMIGIIGLAHDIGKIESFIFDSKMNVIGAGAEHDLTGSRMIARMDEAWEIPSADRDALFMAIAHYHHPIDLPLRTESRDGVDIDVVRDDRTVALMELLIRADFTVGRIEDEKPLPTEDEYLALDAVRSISAEHLFDEFVKLIHETHRINSSLRNYSIGQISPGVGGKGSLLYLHEVDLRRELLRRLDIKNPRTEKQFGRYEIIMDLLRVLKSRNLLFDTFNGIEFDETYCYWKCDIFGSKDQKISEWPSVIILRIDSFERLQQMGFYGSVMRVTSNRFGDQYGRTLEERDDDVMLIGNVGAINDIPKAAVRKSGKSKPEMVSVDQPQKTVNPGIDFGDVDPEMASVPRKAKPAKRSPGGAVKATPLLDRSDDESTDAMKDAIGPWTNNDDQIKPGLDSSLAPNLSETQETNPIASDHASDQPATSDDNASKNDPEPCGDAIHGVIDAPAPQEVAMKASTPEAAHAVAEPEATLVVKQELQTEPAPVEDSLDEMDRVMDSPVAPDATESQASPAKAADQDSILRALKMAVELTRHKKIKSTPSGDRYLVFNYAHLMATTFPFSDIMQKKETIDCLIKKQIPNALLKYNPEGLSLIMIHKDIGDEGQLTKR